MIPLRHSHHGPYYIPQSLLPRRRKNKMVFKTFMCAKLHNIEATACNFHYQGSITLDPDLMDKVGILPNQEVHVLNKSNNARMITYAIPGERGSGDCCVNGAAARDVVAGDRLIVIAYLTTNEEPPIPKVLEFN